MFRNYFKTAFRNLLRYKLFSSLNIFGLATGMACSILIFLWVQDEISFDSFNHHADKIFRLTAKVSDVNAAVVPPPLAYAMKTEIPAIKNTTKLTISQQLVTIGTKKFDEKGAYFADTNFLKIFNYPLLYGNAAAVLSSPDNVVLTEGAAKKYFGSAKEAIGKTIYLHNISNGKNLAVSGILKDLPSNSHLQFNMLLPIELYDNTGSNGWNNFDAFVYFQLKDAVAPTATNVSNVITLANNILKKNNKELQTSLSAQSLTDIHLRSHYVLDVPGQGEIQYVNIFSLAAIFIIIIASINFMNLATAVSGQRAKEVGLRKTIGALQPQLVAQFIGESLLLSFISLGLAVLIVYITLPGFNQLSNKTISFNLFDARILLSLIVIAVITGLVSGSYPAFYLSSFNPVKALKGIKIPGSQKSFLRNGLVVLQFSISVVLIITTLVVYNQLNYMRTRDIGFNKENLLYMELPAAGGAVKNKDAMKAALAQYPDIISYTFANHLPTNLMTGEQLTWKEMKPGTQVIASKLSVDENFATTFDMHMAAGRFFSKEFSGDDSSYVINETALKIMKINVSEAVGKIIHINDRDAPIIGVVKDFNFKPVRQPIEPLVMRNNFEGGYVVMRTTPANMQKIVSTLQKSSRSIYGEYPFNYGFIDEDLANLYITEQRMEKLFDSFSILSIVISCLGLFGLATFASQRRIKEIGVRKVLGASEAGIVALLSKDFMRLVMVSFIIAFPVAWWAMDNWLQRFAYRIDISWWMFAAAGVVTMMIAFLTVSFQAVRAAIAKPVASLRTE